MGAEPQILIVDDDPRLGELLVRGLSERGMRADWAADAAAARAALDSERVYDAVLLDVMLPGESGFELLARMRERGLDVPVIFLTARSEVADRVQGLRTGADDYLVKPFAFDELIARLEAVLRRRAPAQIVRGSLRIDPTGRIVEIGGRRVELSPREFDLLRVLAASAGAVLSRDELLSRVWGIDFDPGTNVVDAAVARLRRRMVGRGGPRIETVVGRGYRLSEDA